jgi:hypothetical protein
MFDSALIGCLQMQQFSAYSSSNSTYCSTGMTSPFYLFMVSAMSQETAFTAMTLALQAASSSHARSA